MLALIKHKIIYTSLLIIYKSSYYSLNKNYSLEVSLILCNTISILPNSRVILENKDWETSFIIEFKKSFKAKNLIKANYKSPKRKSYNLKAI